VRKEDIVELIRVDLPDHTNGAFDVKIESDDGGAHISIFLEDHTNSQVIMGKFSRRFKDSRILIIKVPKGSLDYLRTSSLKSK